MERAELEGTVIRATHRVEALIPAFMDVLEDHDPQRAQQVSRDYANVLWTIEYTNKYENGYIRDEWRDGADYLLNDVLFDALDELAPDGMYFGAHPGDGSDFGFWRVECNHDCDHIPDGTNGYIRWYCRDCGQNTGHMPV